MSKVGRGPGPFMRMLVLMEHPEGVFTQVMMEHETFRQVSDLIGYKTNHSARQPDSEIKFVPMLPEWHVEAHHFDGLKDFYENVPRAFIDDEPKLKLEWRRRLRTRQMSKTLRPMHTKST